MNEMLRRLQFDISNIKETTVLQTFDLLICYRTAVKVKMSSARVDIMDIVFIYRKAFRLKI